MTTPNKREYIDALEKVKKYEDRQKVLNKLNAELGRCLERFSQFKFDVDVDSKTVYFSGILMTRGNPLEDKLVTAKSVARHGDKFEDSIGKLISVKKTLCEDYEYIYKDIESNYRITTGTLNTGLVRMDESEVTYGLPSIGLEHLYSV